MIKINEQFIEYKSDISLFDLRDKFKPEADIMIYNGFPISEDRFLADGDEVVFIKRGEVPSKDDLEGLMLSRHTPGVHKRLKASVVGVAGIGGLGSSVAIALARIGIGKLILADFDIVEPSNLNRQQYFINQIGMPKVHAMRDNLRQINPYVEVDIYQVILDEANVPDIFSGVNVLVEAFDRPDMKSMLINSFLDSYPEGYVVSASGLAGYDSANLIKTHCFGDRLFVVGDRVSAAMPGRGLMAPRVGVAAHHQANKVLEIILGDGYEHSG